MMIECNFYIIFVSPLEEFIQIFNHLILSLDFKSIIKIIKNNQLNKSCDIISYNLIPPRCLKTILTISLSFYL